MYEQLVGEVWAPLPIERPMDCLPERASGQMGEPRGHG